MTVLNIFSKIYGIVLKNELVSVLSDYMSPFIAAYREGYSTQHVLVVRRLIKEWWKKLDDDWVVGGVRVEPV